MARLVTGAFCAFIVFGTIASSTGHTTTGNSGRYISEGVKNATPIEKRIIREDAHAAGVAAVQKVQQKIEAQQQAQQQQQASASSTAGSGGWAIPTTAVMCESNGQNLPPNAATAAGYYQITHDTWTQNGGLRFAPEADMATLDQQSQIASAIYNDPAKGGPGAWDCITGRR